MDRLCFEGPGKGKSKLLPSGVVVGYLSSRLGRGKPLLLPSFLCTSKEGGQKRMGLSCPNYVFQAGHGRLRGFRVGDWVDDLGREFTCCPILKIPSSPALL